MSPGPLDSSCFSHPRGDSLGRFAWRKVVVGGIEAWHMNSDIETIEQGTRYLAPVSHHDTLSTNTWLSVVAEVATRAGIRRPHQLEVGWEGQGGPLTRYRKLPLFERLSQSVEMRARIFGQLIEKENSVVRQ
jgi:hypothetical protein